jgi:plastocyanin
MKKIYSILLLSMTTLGMNATSYTITTVGTTYSPPTLNVSIGDVVTISSSSTHPLAEVSLATWNANGTATLSTGFGNKISNYTFTITSTTSIYYVCTNHVSSMGMKGQINVSTVGINELTEAFENINIFPNPAKDNFAVKFNATENGNVTVKLYSLCGHEIESLILNKEFYSGVNILNLKLQNTITAGVYFVELNYNSKKVISKLMID